MAVLPPAERAALSSAKPRALADRHGAGHPRSHAAEEGRAGGLLHEHAERGAAGAEVSPVLPVSPCVPPPSTLTTRRVLCSPGTAVASAAT